MENAEAIQKLQQAGYKVKIRHERERVYGKPVKTGHFWEDEPLYNYFQPVAFGGKTEIVVSYTYNGVETSWKTTAVCHPKERFVKKIGVATAIQRVVNCMPALG